MNDGTIVRIVAILCLTAIEIVNSFTTKYDGTLLNLVLLGLLALAGYDYIKGKAQEQGSEQK